VTYSFRWADRSDFDALGEVMFDAIRTGDSPYDEQQRRAWLPVARSGPEWEARLASQEIILAEAQSRVAGFMSLAAGGYIDFAYIRPDAQHSGLFRRLFEHIKECARARGDRLLWVHASLSAQPAFAAMGFTVRHGEVVQMGDQQLRRFEMEMPMP
jgi:putative acetyltransferase